MNRLTSGLCLIVLTISLQLIGCRACGCGQTEEKSSATADQPPDQKKPRNAEQADPGQEADKLSKPGQPLLPGRPVDLATAHQPSRLPDDIPENLSREAVQVIHKLQNAQELNPSLVQKSTDSESQPPPAGKDGEVVELRPILKADEMEAWKNRKVPRASKSPRPKKRR